MEAKLSCYFNKYVGQLFDIIIVMILFKFFIVEKDRMRNFL